MLTWIGVLFNAVRPRGCSKSRISRPIILLAFTASGCLGVSHPGGGVPHPGGGVPHPGGGDARPSLGGENKPAGLVWSGVGILPLPAARAAHLPSATPLLLILAGSRVALQLQLH